MTSPPNQQQLALALRRPGPRGLAGFIPVGNEVLLAAVQRWSRGEGETYLFVHGAAASGKTRLLLCAAEEARGQGRDISYLPLNNAALAPAALDDLEHSDGVLLDSLEACAGQHDWEQALFSLYNRMRDQGKHLMVSARAPCARLGLQLPDLQSRLAAGAAFNLKPLDDQGCAELLRTGAIQRGMKLDEPVIRYLLSRCPREPGVLAELIERIDRTTLAEQRQPSIRTIGRLLEQHLADHSPQPEPTHHPVIVRADERPPAIDSAEPKSAPDRTSPAKPDAPASP